MLLGKSRDSFKKTGEAGPSGNDAPLWMCLVVKVKSSVVKNNTAQEPGMLGPSVQFSCPAMSDSLQPHGL